MSVDEASRTKAVVPVFIGGCERSGTTLLGTMLGAHDRAIVTPESQFKTDLARRLSGVESDVSALLPAIRGHWRYRHWNVDPGADEVDCSSYASLLASLVRAYGRRHGRGGPLWVDHSPNNLRHAELLVRLFPEARFLHIVRDGRAVFASVRPLDWGPNTALVGATWWAQRLAYGLALETAMPDRTLRVEYESLVTSPERTMRRLADWLDVPFQNAMVTGGGMDPVGYTAGQHRLVTAPPDASRAAGFRARLTRREIETFEASTFDLLPMLGYATDFGGMAAPPSRREKLEAYLIEAIRRPLNRRRWRLRLRRSLAQQGAA